MTPDQMKLAGADPAQIRAAHPMIAKSPKYDLFLAAREHRAWLELLARIIAGPATVIAAAIAGYREEYERMMDAPAIYLGPGR
ncbi:MAG: hypothetical protein KBE22_00115 [Candidatus Accumulibacter sp.]|nr:hypothetical protein [Accumulibacter sp.]